MNTEKTKLLIVSHDMNIGGVERSLISLLEALDYNRYDVDLFLYSHTGDFLPMLPPQVRLLPENKKYKAVSGPLKEALRGGRFRIAFGKLQARFRFQRAWKQGRIPLGGDAGFYSVQCLRECTSGALPEIPGEYDAAISFVWPHHCVADRVHAKRKLAWIHTDYSGTYLDYKRDERVWSRFDRIVAVSEECRKSFAGLYPHLADRLCVVENLLDPGFVRRQSELQDVSRELPREEGVTNIVSVGRLSYPKGFDEAIRACRLLLDRGYRIRWYVVGYGEKEKSLRALIEEHRVEGTFFLLGKKLNPYPYMKACDIYAQPSRYEGKAVTVREAQILARPVLITNFGTAGSQVENGADGYITPLGPEGIADGVAYLIDHPEVCRSLSECAAGRDYGNRDEIKKLYAYLDKK